MTILIGMTKLIALVFVLGACAADSEPQFDLVTCNDGNGLCSRACNSQAASPPFTGPRCDSAYTIRNGEYFDWHSLLSCPATFEWNGIQGCCLNINDDMPSDAEQYFLQCD